MDTMKNAKGQQVLVRHKVGFRDTLEINPRSRDASAPFPARGRFFPGPVWVVSGSYGRFPAAKATDSRLGAPSYSEL